MTDKNTPISPAEGCETTTDSINGAITTGDRSAELVAELREAPIALRDEWPSSLLIEAADALSSLTSRLEIAERERDEARAAVVDCMAALAPIAWDFDLNDCKDRSDDDAMEISIKDLRRANDTFMAVTLNPFRSQLSTAAKAMPTEEEIARVRDEILKFIQPRYYEELSVTEMKLIADQSARIGARPTECCKGLAPESQCACAQSEKLAADKAAAEEVVEALRKLDELDAKRTKGPWKVILDNDREAPLAFVMGKGGNAVTDYFNQGQEDDAAFIVALENAWPILRAALTHSPAAAGVPTEEALDALKPFASFAAVIASEHPGWDHDDFEFRIAGHYFTLKPFRNARAVLSLLQSAPSTEGGEKP